jgi:hypothetical protein
MYIRKEDYKELLERVKKITSIDYSYEEDKSLIEVDNLFAIIDDLIYEYDKKVEEIDELNGWKEEEPPMSEREFH